MNARYVIVGASAAGVSAAMELRRQGFDGDITLFSAENSIPYERPAVSKEALATGVTPLIVPGSFYEDQKIRLCLGYRVTAIDRQAGTVQVADGHTEPADKILIATGGRVRRLAVPGAHLRGVHYLRDVQDALDLREAMRPGSRVAVVGGGLIGGEVVAGAVMAGCTVSWIEAGPRCLTRALASPLDEVMSGIHRDRGVRILTRSSVARLLGETNAYGLELADGRRIEADMVVVGIGIDPVTELAQSSGAVVGDGIAVDGYCKTSVSNIYAAGDVALHKTRYQVVAGRTEHWSHAQKHGAAAARSMLGVGEPYDDLPWFWTNQYEHHIEGCGTVREGDTIITRGQAGDSSMTVFYLRHGGLAGAVSLNRPNDVRASIRLISRSVTPPLDALRDPNVDLRKIEREAA